jgi:hypothetical protein
MELRRHPLLHLRLLSVAAVLGLALSGIVSPVRAQSLASWTGARADYRVTGPSGVRPELTQVTLSLPGVAIHDGQEHIWFQMEAINRGARQYAIAMLVPSLDFLSGAREAVPVARYILFPPGGQPLEYVRKATGEAMLPRYDFWERLVPRSATPGGIGPALFDEGTLMGRSLTRIDQGMDARSLPIEDAKRLELEPEVLIGTSRDFRDDGTGRRHRSTGGDASEGPDYRYVSFDAENYRSMIDAGMNLFRIRAPHAAWVIEEPVFIVQLDGFEDSPEVLYRSNYFGAVMYMDEPMVRAVGTLMFARTGSASEAATLQIELIRGRIEGSNKYGSRHLDRLLRRAGCDLGPGEILQADYPVWEAMASGAWYELEAGGGGFCHESRIQPERFAELVESALGVRFPSDVVSCVDFHLSLFTGAARWFERPWGVSIYGQTEEEAAEILFPRAYERGATYFWFWTSDGAHHVPFSRQLELTRQLRRYIRENPRGEAEARTALVLPWGYLLDDFAFRPNWKLRKPALWGSEKLSFENRNSEGVRYREVLAAAMREAADLLRAGERFDILFLQPEERARGYARVLRVRETGRVEGR